MSVSEARKGCHHSGVDEMSEDAELGSSSPRLASSGVLMVSEHLMVDDPSSRRSYRLALVVGTSAGGHE